MSAEDIFNTPGCNRDTWWLRAVRALPDAEFERLVQMQEAETRFCNDLAATLTGASAMDNEATG